MKTVLRAVVIMISVLLVGWLLWSHELQLRSALWHWKYGGTIAVGRYIIPVPDHWLPSWLATEQP